LMAAWKIWNPASMSVTPEILPHSTIH